MSRPRKPATKPIRRPRRAASPPVEGERKRDATRKHLLERALALFQKRGVEATTMRDIAKAAGMSLGAAYYYFPSKEALVFAYYEDNQADLEQLAQAASGTVREQLGTIFHGKLATIRPQRKMLAAIVQRLVDPSDPVSAFSAQTRAVRDHALGVLDRVLVKAGLPPEVLPLATRALWLLQMAMMLVYVNDDSPDERRTHGLVDDALDMIVPMLPMLATPMGRALAERVTAALTRAEIV
ncbi:MAG: TetR/AcrR family transcriptional regulator [Myxococcales bacterium]|nr:TetR/AcrR family transcriptional regulator [Myxococcales bacterium]